MKIISILIQWILNIFRYQKKKVFFFLGSTVFCLLILFPFDDLSDFITMKISEVTRNNLYLQFDDLSFSLFPLLGVKMGNVVVESSYAPTVKLESLNIAPNVTSLITGRPGGKVKARGFFDGNASIQFGPSRELNLDKPEMGVNLYLEKVKLENLSQFLKKTYQFPLSLSGETDVESEIHIDIPGFREQPKGDFKIHIRQMKIPSSQIPLGYGMNFPFPSLEFNQLSLVANIDDKKLSITEGKIGDKKNDLHGSITGDIFLDFQPGGRLKDGGYDLKINLNISNTLKEQMGAVFGFIDIYQGIGEKYKFDDLNGVRYSMQLSANSFQSPPRISSF